MTILEMAEDIRRVIDSEPMRDRVLLSYPAISPSNNPDPFEGIFSDEDIRDHQEAYASITDLVRCADARKVGIIVSIFHDVYYNILLYRSSRGDKLKLYRKVARRIEDMYDLEVPSIGFFPDDKSIFAKSMKVSDESLNSVLHRHLALTRILEPMSYHTDIFVDNIGPNFFHPEFDIIHFVDSKIVKELRDFASKAYKSAALYYKYESEEDRRKKECLCEEWLLHHAINSTHLPDDESHPIYKLCIDLSGSRHNLYSWETDKIMEILKGYPNELKLYEKSKMSARGIRND